MGMGNAFKASRSTHQLKRVTFKAPAQYLCGGISAHDVHRAAESIRAGDVGVYTITNGNNEETCRTSVLLRKRPFVAGDTALHALTMCGMQRTWLFAWSGLLSAGSAAAAVAVLMTLPRNMRVCMHATHTCKRVLRPAPIIYPTAGRNADMDR